MTHLLVDGNGLVCRLWWANAGNIVERFQRCIEQVIPGHESIVTVAWDSGASWRREIYPEYKANRPPKPKALVEALWLCKHFSGRTADEMQSGIEPWGRLEAEGFEADDCIATECRRSLLAGEFVVVVSDDKDMSQLVGERCLWLAGGKIHNRDAVIEKFGVPPDRIRHLLSWIGDSVDGLPGVRGYGKKKAVPKALAGEIGNHLTYELTELAEVPCSSSA